MVECVIENCTIPYSFKEAAQWYSKASLARLDIVPSDKRLIQGYADAKLDVPEIHWQE